MKPTLMFTLVGLLGLSALAAENDTWTDPRQKFSYSLGLSIGGNLGRIETTLTETELQWMVRGIQDRAAGQARLTDEEVQLTLNQFQQQAWAEIAARNRQRGTEFLEQNKAREGVVTLPSGLQYEILTAGDPAGTPPKATDRATVHYRGTLINGTEFDSSHRRGQPATFAVNGVIRGWTEALQLMKPGAKWKLFIPPDLAYGERPPSASIPPNSTLLFEVELLSVETPPPVAAPAPQPVTSDIIKVPSREEMERGAKVEIIKASELEKYLEEEKAKAKPDQE